MREENPFEDVEVAEQWIRSVENEEGEIRDGELYPHLERWMSNVRPRTVVEIGSGQGICSQKLGRRHRHYVGIEPSPPLIKRAHELYPREDFRVGNAYDLPLQDRWANACFSVNVWFHLENLDQAAREMARVLETDGRFLIITANPQSYGQWLDMYSDVQEDGKKFVGVAHVPVNPLSRNVFYRHAAAEISISLGINGLVVEEWRELGFVDQSPNLGLFVAIEGYKTY